MADKPKSNNPHHHETPEWQLFENMKGSELAAVAFQADAERYIAKAEAARAKAAAFRTALEKLEK